MNIYELLNIVLNSMDAHFMTGLCGLVQRLNYDLNIITIEEAEILYKYLREHKPITIKILIGDSYWWRPGNSKPRKRWLKRHIIKNKHLLNIK